MRKCTGLPEAVDGSQHHVGGVQGMNEVGRVSIPLAAHIGSPVINKKHMTWIPISVYLSIRNKLRSSFNTKI